MLDFDYDGERLTVQAEVIRSRLHDIAPDQRLFRSGLRFLRCDEALWAVVVSLALDHMRITAA